MVTPSRPPVGANAVAQRSAPNMGLNTPITPAIIQMNRPNPQPQVPRFNPQPQPQPQPQQRQQAPQAPPVPKETEDKHVTFVESQDEYDFGSDDAFYATVDLEGLGDAGIGGHIDFEEGNGAVDAELGEDVGGNEGRNTTSVAPPEKPHQPLQRIPAQPQQGQPQPKTGSGKTRKEILEEYERERLRKEREANQRSGQLSEQSAHTSTSPPVSANTTPSQMGGFRFPPNMDSNQRQNQSGRSTGQVPTRAGGSNLSANTGTGSGIGLKRTFDAIQ